MEEDDAVVESEAGIADAWAKPKPSSALENVTRFAGMEAINFDEEESDAEEWDDEMVIEHLKDKTAKEIRARIDAQFGESVSHASLGSRWTVTGK